MGGIINTNSNRCQNNIGTTSSTCRHILCKRSDRHHDRRFGGVCRFVAEYADALWLIGTVTVAAGADWLVQRHRNSQIRLCLEIITA